MRNLPYCGLALWIEQGIKNIYKKVQERGDGERDEQIKNEVEVWSRDEYGRKCCEPRTEMRTGKRQITMARGKGRLFIVSGNR